MACSRRQKTGDCSHHLCEFSDQSGYECVQIISAADIREWAEAGMNTKDLVAGKCELSPSCVRKCRYN